MSEYHNPQQQPGMDKNLILIFIFTFIAIIVGQQFLSKNAPQPPAGEKQPTQQQQGAAAAPAASIPTSAPTTASQPKGAVPAAVRQASAESEIVLESDVYRVTFTNRGGQVKSWILKNYKDDKGNPLELVAQKGSAEFGYPLSLWTWDNDLKTKLNSALYVSDAGPNLTAPATVNFDYSDGDITVHKAFKFDTSYVLSVETSVTRNGVPVTALTSWPAGFGDMTVPSSYGSQRIDISNGSDVTRQSSDKKGKDISNGRIVQGPIEWGGATDQYFAAIFLPDNPQQAVLAQIRNGMKIPKDPAKPNPEETFHVELLGAAAGQLNAPVKMRMFVGPKAVDILQAVHPAGGSGDLRGVVDFGRFSFISRPLFMWLRWTYDHWVSNWGWAIIILTVIINIALLPLRVISMRSALKMQKIAPQVQAINEKYKKYSIKDPRRAEANKEISALYKEHDVNPAGGCLPLLIQMPFLFAFWAMLSAAIELRGAHWYWLHDLAQPDKYYIIPFIIIASTFWMQKMTPQAGMNPEQAKMMNLMMPLMLGFMSYSVASGLGLYWLTGTVVAIVQQWGMNQTALGREIRAINEKRARKREGK